MKYAFALVAAAAFARAQTREDIPECALPCLDKAITDNSDCKTTDYACVCKNFDAIRGSATTCVIDECGPTVALNEVLPATEALCKAAGSGGESSAPAASSSAAATSAAAESTSVVETTSVEVVTTTSAATVEVPTTVETSVAAPTNGTVPTTSAAPPAGTPVVPPTGGAAGLGSMGALAMLALGALAL